MKEKVKTGGIGLGTIVFIVFLIMKLMNISPVAELSWFWVTAPLWITTAIFIVIFLGFIIIGFISMIVLSIIEKFK